MCHWPAAVFDVDRSITALRHPDLGVDVTADCFHYLDLTVTPADPTVTVTATFTRKITHHHLSVITATSYETTVVSTDIEIDSVTGTSDVTATSIETSTVVVHSTVFNGDGAVEKRALRHHRNIPHTHGGTTFPAYASPCAHERKYASACRRLGVTPDTVTVSPTGTVTRTVFDRTRSTADVVSTTTTTVAESWFSVTTSTSDVTVSTLTTTVATRESTTTTTSSAITTASTFPDAVVNGGFEDGTTGWTVTEGRVAIGGYFSSHSFESVMQGQTAVMRLLQKLQTVTSLFYTCSVYAAIDDVQPAGQTATVQVSLNGYYMTAFKVDSNDYTQFTFSLYGSTSDQLQFASTTTVPSSGDTLFLYIDDVSCIGHKPQFG
ncbi:hypothetical protein SPI_07937 [Niveomyces insectorum RCEF 264]|uniref:Uncharacterized protein n=1 Tax=Niveomyces insectorum RCEF 264 TaxID=1081102 RepID=A0A167P5X7_9HYPO|nr:hypothetical protein SPI_07937 [Niveomyces insectorum RCEF 264]